MGKNLCFTGHRPEKLMTRFDENSLFIKKIKEYLMKEIKLAIEEGYDSFYSGMARGVDLFASEIVLQLKQKHKHIKHVAVIPYRGQELKWNLNWQERYRKIVSQSDIQFVLSDIYYNNCLTNRNIFMVENCQRVVGIYLGGRNGTAHTIEYARQLQREIHLMP